MGREGSDRDGLEGGKLITATVTADNSFRAMVYFLKLINYI